MPESPCADVFGGAKGSKRVETVIALLLLLILLVFSPEVPRPPCMPTSLSLGSMFPRGGEE